MSSRSVFLILATIFLLSFSVSYAAPSDDVKEIEDVTTEVKDVTPGDEEAGKMTELPADTSTKINTSVRVPGTPFKIACLLCEGSTPFLKCFQTRNRAVFLFPATSGSCSSRIIRGNGRTNHASLFNNFTGIDYFLERYIVCNVGQVCLVSRIGGITKRLFCCNRNFEAIAVTAGI